MMKNKLIVFLLMFICCSNSYAQDSEELIKQLTESSQKGQDAYFQLIALKLEALPTLSDHLNDDRKSLFNPDHLTNVLNVEEMEWANKNPQATIGDVCFAVIISWLDDEECRYFDFFATKEEIIKFLQNTTYSSFTDLQIKAAEYVLEQSSKFNYKLDDIYKNRIKELKNNQDQLITNQSTGPDLAPNGAKPGR